MSAGKVNKPWLKFDGAIHAGHIMMVMGFMIGLIGNWYLMDWRLSTVEAQIHKMTSLVESNIKFNEQLAHSNKEIEYLKRRVEKIEDRLNQ